MNKGRISLSALIAIAAMLIVLPLLAYQQYVWLGQLGEREFDRMLNNLHAAAKHLSWDFNEEVSGLLHAVGKPLSGTIQQNQEELNRRVQEWRRTTQHPRLVGELTVAPLPPGADTISLRGDKLSWLILFKDLSAVAVPIEGRPDRYGIVMLNKEYLHQEYLPSLVDAHFSLNGRNDYEITVVGRNGMVFFQSDTTANDRTERVDVVEPFLYLPAMLRPAHPPSAEIGPPPNAGGLREQRVPPPEFDKGKPSGDRIAGDMGRFGGGPYSPQALYELRVTHRAGSLEAAVAQSRHRNIVIGFGILLLLGASMVFVLVSSNRERQLARQQLEFVAAISHELRTPLTVLKSAGENLADGVIHDMDRAEEYGKVIKEEVGRLSDMVEKALAFAGVQSGKRKYERQLVNIPLTVAAAVKNAKRQGRVDGHTFDVSVPDDLPYVLGDEDALRVALENIISNAIKYGGIERWVGIHAQCVQKGNRRVNEIAIEDRGIGVPPADRRHVFQSFYRGSNAVDSQIPGSGLGLTITREIIEQHDGSITMQSSDRSGSTVTVTLPCFPASGDQI